MELREWMLIALAVLAVAYVFCWRYIWKWAREEGERRKEAELRRYCENDDERRIYLSDKKMW